jgi:hypothetical protein
MKLSLFEFLLFPSVVIRQLNPTFRVRCVIVSLRRAGKGRKAACVLGHAAILDRRNVHNYSAFAPVPSVFLPA